VIIFYGRRLLPLLLFVGIACGDTPEDLPPASDTSTVTSLEDIGLLARMGTQEQESPAAILHAPLDGVLSGDEVIVLDESDPWVRIFHRSGQFLRAVGQAGLGPGEAVNPSAITATGQGYTLWENQGLVELGAEGESRQGLGRFGYRVRGGMACGNDLLVLASTLLPSDQPSVLARMHQNGALDTLLVLGPQRVQALQYPFFGVGGNGSLIVYTDEIPRDRLLEVACDGTLLQEIDVPPLGSGERWEQTERGWTLHPAIPPFPAGLGRVDGVVIWAEQERLGPDEGPEAEWATVFTALSGDASPPRLRIPGRYQILDDAPDGALLLGVREPLPEVVLLDGRALPQALVGAGGGSGRR